MRRLRKKYVLWMAIALALWPAVGARGIGLPDTTEPLVVIDAGHGGEDGGAVAADGTRESRINLEISRQLEQVLVFTGCPVRLLRTGEESLADREAETLREKKVSDLKKRVALTEEWGGDVLLSIHQNSLPDHPEVHGAQAFYNALPRAEVLASSIQDFLNQIANPAKQKLSRAIDGSVYLMRHAPCPAVLVECGFLSHPGETERLQRPDYQRQLAVSMAAGYLKFRNK